jgi:hypothetical protein
MTLAIIGGLLIIALLAILGAIFLSRTDQRTARLQTARIAASTSDVKPLIQQSSAANPANVNSATLSQNVPSTVERATSPAMGGQQQYPLNGQFHELTIELQTLYQHAWELERRLRTLTEVASRIEKTQSNEVSTEQEIHASSSIDSNQ